MKSFQALLLITLYTCSTGQIVPQDKIVNGKRTTIEEHPFQVSILYMMSHFCGGSIIKSTVILTAAHCTENKSPQWYMVRAGVTSIMGKSGVFRRIVKLYQHPKYAGDVSQDYDISIFIIQQLPLSDRIGVVDLIPLNYNLIPGEFGEVTGWGYTKENGEVSVILQSVKVPFLDTDYCEKVYEDQVTDRMLCFGYKEGKKDACQGDSGGPIIVNNKQIGIVSWGYGCALPENPGVYTNLLNVEIRKFIMEVLRKS